MIGRRDRAGLTVAEIRRRRRPPLMLGAFLVLLLAIGAYLAFAKRIPFTDRGYELNATFTNAATLRVSSPVRIAGVNVGEVTDVHSEGDVSVATFTVSDEGRPIHEDATVEIRPRLFLEGNFFLDLRPGSPSGEELSDGDTIPVGQTATAVQLDEILTSLNSASRADLQELLRGFGGALTREPTAADDATQDPAVRGETAAEALNDAFAHGGDAGRDLSIANEALLGTQPHDLSRLILAQRDVFGKLSSVDEQLADLVTDFNVTAGALADDSAALSRAIAELAPTVETATPALSHLNTALPPVQDLADELIPGVRELPETIRTGEPWLVQAGRLLQQAELGGVAANLARAAPATAETAHAAIRLFPQVELASRCVSDVVIPAGNQVIDSAGGTYPFSTGEPNYREFFYAAVNLAGESQGFDGNGSYVRFQTGGGPETVTAPIPGGIDQNDSVWGHTVAPPLGTRPALPASGKPPFRTDIPCHENDPPDVNGIAAAVGPPSPEVYP